MKSKYRVPTRALIFLAIAIAAIVCFAGRQARPIAAQSEPTQPAIAGCWDVFSGLLEREYHGLHAISSLSDHDVWAVGFHTPEKSKSMTLVTHWDGTRWTVVPSPSPGAFSNILTGVAAIAPDNVWAVGYLGMAGTDSKTLILHWDGKVWTQVPSPNTDARNNNLTAIAAASANDVWAVGFYKDSPNNEQMLILHWDGSTWIQATTPELPAPRQGLLSTSQLTGVTAIAANDVWAVGYNAFDTSQSLITLHWNGTTWSAIPTPSLPQGGILSAVSASGSNNVWAVGSQVANHAENVSSQTLAIRWDGTAWSVVPTPNVSLEGNSWSFLNAVTTSPGGEAWAFGTYQQNRTPNQPLFLKWNGSAWGLVSSPVRTYSTDLNGAAITPGESALWVVGSRSSVTGGNQEGLMLRHTSGPCATPAPIVTMTPPVPLPGTGSTTFPETGKAVSGIFLDYWKGHGGLMQQGYPISEVMGEVSDLDGKLYTVQYFEHAVFEYHPENKPPYDVLLSQLGTFEYRRRYGTQGAPDQHSNNEPGSVLFPQTGHRLGGAFQDYWQRNGGLMQQGYPISDEFTEVSALDGKEYIVQYFERAVFEWRCLHPLQAEYLRSPTCHRRRE